MTKDNDGPAKLVVNDVVPDPDQPSEALAEEPKPKRTVMVANVVEGVQQGYREVEVDE